MLKTRRARLSMTSLIDVIFLLLLFFMLTSTFSRFGEIPITLGGAGTAGETSQAAPLFVRVTEDGPTLNGTALSAEELAEAIHGEADDPQVLVSLAETAHAQALADTLHALRSLPDAQIVVLQ